MIIDRLYSTMRGRNALLNIFEMWVGLAGIISGIVFFYDPNSITRNSLSVTIGIPAAKLLICLYFGAGIAVWYGLLRPNPRIEVAALFALGIATSYQGIAVCSVFGLRGAAMGVTLLALTCASWLRGAFVIKATIRLSKDLSARS